MNKATHDNPKDTVVAGRAKLLPPGRLPTFPPTQGGRRHDPPPAGVKLQTVNPNAVPRQLCSRKWLQEIVNRGGGAAELAREALGRLSHSYSEERLLEAQAILTMLGQKWDAADHVKAILTDANTLAMLLEGSR